MNIGLIIATERPKANLSTKKLAQLYKTLKEKEITALLEKIVENKIVKNQEKIKEIYNREFTNKKVIQLIEFLNKRWNTELQNIQVTLQNGQ